MILFLLLIFCFLKMIYCNFDIRIANHFFYIFQFAVRVICSLRWWIYHRDQLCLFFISSYNFAFFHWIFKQLWWWFKLLLVTLDFKFDIFLIFTWFSTFLQCISDFLFAMQIVMISYLQIYFHQSFHNHFLNQNFIHFRFFKFISQIPILSSTICNFPNIKCTFDRCLSKCNHKDHQIKYFIIFTFYVLHFICRNQLYFEVDSAVKYQQILHYS